MRKAGIGWILAALAAALLALSAFGAAALWDGDHHAAGLMALLQAPIYGIAAWLVIARTTKGLPSAPPITGRAALAGILLVGLAMRLIVLPSPPSSSDIYRYIWDGRVQAAGINPYRYPPADAALQALRDEAIYPNINRASYAPTIYPPVAQLVFLTATRISETPVFMKTVMVAFEGLAVWAILRLLAARGLPATRVLLYAWHPLPVWEFAGSGHADAVAIAFLLLGFVAADRRSPVLAGMALAAGVLVKYFPAVAGPAIYKRWDWRLPAAFAASLAALYLPYLGAGTKVFGFLGGYVAEEGLEQGSGIFLWQLAGTVLHLPEHAFSFYFPLAAVVMAAMGLAVVGRRREPKADLAAAMLLAVTFMVLFSPHYPWYFTWLIPFVCVHPLAAVIYLTCAASYLHISDWPPSLGEGLLLYGGFALILVGELAIRRIRRFSKKEEVHVDALPA
jgi:alpha-1,6-mannosyltransferase